MAETTARNADSEKSKQSGETGVKAPNEKPRKVNGNKAPKAASKGRPRKSRRRGKDKPNNNSQVAPNGFSGRVKDYVEQHFDEILNGVLKGIEQGNASGAKLLLDYCKTDAEQEGKKPDVAKNLRLSDILGVDFDWKSLQQTEQPAAGEAAVEGVEDGVGGREPE